MLWLKIGKNSIFGEKKMYFNFLIQKTKIYFGFFLKILVTVLHCTCLAINDKRLIRSPLQQARHCKQRQPKKQIVAPIA